MILDKLDEVLAAATKRIHRNIDAMARGEKPKVRAAAGVFALRCSRCKRPLSDTRSLVNGMGATCARQALKEAA